VFILINPVEHYAKLALLPEWIDYVRHQVREMEKHRMFTGLGKAVAQRIKELNASNK
jgi:transketolase C-terminal domain/subunit